MKNFKTIAWMMATAIAGMTMTACSSDDYEPAKPFTTDPVELNKLYAYGIDPSATKLAEEGYKVLFTEDDIEWFDLKTREIRFKDDVNKDEPLYKRLQPFNKIGIQLSDYFLFEISSFVGLWDSRIFYDLVLCYGKMEGEVQNYGKYYLYDCYPIQFINDEQVQANIKKNAAQWQAFIKFLDSKGKLR